MVRTNDALSTPATSGHTRTLFAAAAESTDASSAPTYGLTAMPSAPIRYQAGWTTSKYVALATYDCTPTLSPGPIQPQRACRGPAGGVPSGGIELEPSGVPGSPLPAPLEPPVPPG